jgi:hypothetical protein
MSKRDGHISIRRYGLFRGAWDKIFLNVVYGEDITRAEKWGSLVKWVGSIRPAEFKDVKKERKNRGVV